MQTVPPHHPGSARERVMCLHSSASSGRQWTPIASALAAQCDVLTPALLGYGEAAAWPAGASVSLDEEALALAPLLHAGPGGVHLVGHSYGGAVALQLALRWPSRVLSLTLFEPVRFALLFGHADNASDEILQLGQQIVAAVRSGRHLAAAAVFVDYWSGTGAWEALSLARRDALAARMPKVRAEFEALFIDLMQPVAYTRLAMPVRLLRGDRSPLPARLVAERLRRLLPRAELLTLRGLGHMGPLTHPAQVAQALPDWLAIKCTSAIEALTVKLPCLPSTRSAGMS